MSSPRLAIIPFEHVEAELATFPLASEASFRLGITSLDPAGEDNKLWRETEKYVLNALPAVPPDEAIALRDELWFDSSDASQINFEPISLLKYVRRLAENYLDPSGRPIQGHSDSVRSDTSSPEARLRWSWMCRALPPDFLRVVRGVVDADAHHFPLHPVVQQMLQDKGFAETHLHLGASLDFSLAWASLVSQLTRSESTYSDFESVGADFEQGRYLGTWLLYGCVIRIVLAEYLFNNPSSGKLKKNLTEFIHNQYDPRLDVVERTRLYTVISQFRHGKWSKERSSISPTERLAKRFARARALYRQLAGPPNIFRNRKTERHSLQALYKPENRGDIYLNDPLARITGWQATEAVSPETLFLAKALQYMEQNEKDTDFAALFWQVTRIRCLAYRHVVQRPLTPGLQWFVRFFSRIKPLRKNIPESVLADTAAHICGKDIGLRSLEVRLGTEKSITECLIKVRNVEKVAHPIDKHAKRRAKQILNKEEIDKLIKERDKEQKFEVGALFHFSRKRGGGWEKGKLNAYGLDHSYPERAPGKKLRTDAGNPSGFRFARFYMEQRRHAQALVSLFQKYPLSLRTVRGFDLCTDEAGVPIWVMAPLIRWVQDAGQQAAKQLKRRGEFMIPPSRLSVHAGEDFVHLLTGLRRLDESVTHLELQEGDRLGHALSLGIDPSLWCQRAGRVIITCEERLFDLIWEWDCYARQGIQVNSERLAYVRTEMVRIAKSIFDKSYSPEDLMNFVSDLHDEKKLRAEGFPNRSALRTSDSTQKDEGNESKRLLRAYLTKKDVWRKGRVPETIDLRNFEHEEVALRKLQNGLRDKVGKRCLTIEVNPSSNLLVGDLGNFIGHPLWRLRPVVSEDRVSPLSVCIGSDDPLTFATTLPHEYQLLFDAMILMGRSHEEAMRWLDTAREAGMESRFTLSPRKLQFSEELRSPNLLGWERPQSPP